MLWFVLLKYYAIRQGVSTMLKSKKSGSDWIGVGDLSTIGLTLAFAIAIGSGLGWWLGGKLGNQSVGLIIGFIIGTAAGFIEMFRAVSRWNRRMENQERRQAEDREIREQGDKEKNG